jgi:mono/diheme cytochrome c family protein
MLINEQEMHRRLAVVSIAIFSLLFLAVARGRTQAAPAKDTYVKKCAVCHGPDGAGQTARGKRLKLKRLASPEVQKLTDTQLYDIIAKGRGKDMPGYEAELGKAGVEQQVAYMRELAKSKVK